MTKYKSEYELAAARRQANLDQSESKAEDAAYIALDRLAQEWESRERRSLYAKPDDPAFEAPDSYDFFEAAGFGWCRDRTRDDNLDVYVGYRENVRRLSVVHDKDTGQAKVVCQRWTDSFALKRGDNFLYWFAYGVNNAFTHWQRDAYKLLRLHEQIFGRPSIWYRQVAV